MNTEARIRTASEADAEQLLEIYRPYVENTAITFEYEVPSVEEFAGRIKNTLKRYPYLVAETSGGVAGYAYVSAFKERAAYDWSVETSIYVSTDKKQLGIGRQLYEDSVYFHEKLGYQMVGRFHDSGYKFNRWYDMVWMEKMIGEHLEDQPGIIPFPDLD